MKPIQILRDITLLSEMKGETIVVETDHINEIETITEAVETNNHLFCVKLRVNQNITSIIWKEAWEKIPMVVYPLGLGAVRDLIEILPVLKKINVKFFLDAAQEQHYEAVQILSSLGIYCGMVISETTDWEKLTDLMYYALCAKAPHAPIEPFQYIYDLYERNRLVDFGRVFFSGERFNFYTSKSTKDFHEGTQSSQTKPWQRFFYEATPCATCAGWRICMGKYANLEDKTKCQNFMVELLQLIESLKFKVQCSRFKTTPLSPAGGGDYSPLNS